MKLKLPKELRPDSPYRACDLGYDLPAWFVYDLRGIDENIYPVWHEYDVRWESIITNNYYGRLDEDRYTINYNYGHLNFGYVIKDTNGPVLECKWHIWRLSRPHGWEHVAPIEYRDPTYLKLLLRRIALQARTVDRYGHKVYREKLEEDNTSRREKKQKEHDELLTAIHEENAWMIRQVKENYERGIIKPHNPQKETINSYAGQSNRSRKSRPLSDKEGGLYLPE